MGKKLNIMSLSIDPEMQDFLKKRSKEEGVSVSKLIRNLVDKFLLNEDQLTVVEHNDNEFIPVVLKIPKKLKGTDEVKHWLNIRANALGDKLRVVEN